MVEIDSIEIRLAGTDLAPGEITFGGLAELADAMRLLALRVGRHLTDHDGAGRTPAAVERASELRLRGLANGSTVLDIAVGEDGLLGDGLEQRTVDALFELFDGIARETPPTWSTPAIGEATLGLLDALALNATSCDLTGGRSASVRIFPRDARREPWRIARDQGRRTGVSVSGRLEMLDLVRSSLRIRDAVGHGIPLRSVVDAAAAAELIGQDVTATGDAVIGPRGQIVSLSGARVAPLRMPGWTMPEIDATLVARQPVVGGLDGVDDAEIDALLAQIRG